LKKGEGEKNTKKAFILLRKGGFVQAYPVPKKEEKDIVIRRGRKGEKNQNGRYLQRSAKLATP